MAEIPDLGEHCALKNCNQLDFVPFRCEHCSSFYCRNHRLPDQHCCVVPDKNEKRKGDGEEELKFLCSMRGCFQRERTRIQCTHCNHNFCMRHRICEDHECGGLEKPSTLLEKQPIQVAIGKQKTETTQNQQQLRPQKKLSAEQQARLDRAEILKLKVKNPLKLAADQQFYIFAHLPQKNGGNRRVVVVSRQWSMLKAIWHIAEQLGFEYNDNLQAFKLQNSSEKEDEDMRPLPLNENVTKLLTNESELILRWKEE